MQQVFWVKKIIFLLESSASIWRERVALVKDSSCCERTYSLCWRGAVSSFQNPAPIMVRAIHSSHRSNPWKKYSIFHIGIFNFHSFFPRESWQDKKIHIYIVSVFCPFSLSSLDSHQIERTWKISTFARGTEKPFCIHKQQLLQKVFDQVQGGVLS